MSDLQPAFICSLVLRRTEDSFSEIAITLLAPYIAWVLAEQVHASAVLACVVGGLYLRHHFSAIVAPNTRIQARAIWDFLVFILNGIIFILIGLQLGILRDAIPSSELGTTHRKRLTADCNCHYCASDLGAHSGLGTKIRGSINSSRRIRCRPGRTFL